MAKMVGGLAGQELTPRHLEAVHTKHCLTGTGRVRFYGNHGSIESHLVPTKGVEPELLVVIHHTYDA